MNLKFLLTGALAIAIVLSSCEKDDYTADPIGLKGNQDLQHGEKSAVAQQSGGAVALGVQLEDPYSIKNMKQAYSNLKAANPGIPALDIQPTHIYMRFLPRNEDEWALLKSDTLLVLYDFPLNFEIANQGTYYQDPSLPDTAITWQYCVLPIKNSIPNIRHEVLYEVYIPDDDENVLKSSSGMEQFLLNLEEESVRLTGNMSPEFLEQKRLKGLLPDKWTPKGVIKVWDNIIGSTTTYTAVFDHWVYYNCGGIGPVPVELNSVAKAALPIEGRCKRAVYRYIPNTTQGSYIPLIGASVHARWFTHIERALTDINGYFQTSRFRYEVNYAIKWETGQYDIRNGMFFQAWYNGPKKKGDWNVNINGGESVMIATMHRAALKHFYGNNLGIRRPTGAGKIKLCYIDKNGEGICWGDWGDWGLLPDIKVWGKRNGVYKPIDEVFGTTTHELGHMSHWWFIHPVNYAQTSKNIYESWADAVEWALSNDEYHKMGAKYGGTNAISYNCDYTNQLKWPHVGDKAYSPIFIDLMDNINQRYRGTSYPNDRITGYTLSYIQNNILRDSYGFTSLSNAIKQHKISGVTDADIDELFLLYW